MRKIVFIYFVLLGLLPLFGVHDFTVNGETSTTVAIGDSLHFEFEFESVGNAADFAFGVELIGQEIPIFSGNYLLFQDGGMLDETGLDGIFAGGFSNFIQLPEGTTLTITLTDDEVSGMVSIEFEQLDTEFSISGSVTQEGDWFDLPVIGGLVYTVYNGGIDVLMELLNNFDLETFLAFIASDHYILSDLTGFLGTYQIFVPEEIPDVVCMTGVYSLLDIEGGFIPPAIQEVSVNGHVSGIDFFYSEPDGDFYGMVVDSENEAIANAGFMMDNPNGTIPHFFTSDSLGNFSISLADGEYGYTVTALGYEILTDMVDISGGDVYREIVLEGMGGIGGEFWGFVYNEENEPIINAEIMVLSMSGADPLYTYSMGDGSFGIDLANGSYSYMASHSMYVGVTGEFEIADGDTYQEITMSPVTGNDEALSLISEVICYPNPFNPITTLHFSIEEEAPVILNIFNLKGQKVNSIDPGILKTGNHQITWNGNDLKNNPCASGIYFFHLKTGNKDQILKAIMLK